MKWQDVEVQVRQIAEHHWNAVCRAEDIGGVRYDAIIRVSPEEMIALEITKEDNINKLRSNISKLAVLRNINFTKQILTRCYFITDKDASSLKQTGEAMNVNVLSVSDFANQFIGTRAYNFNDRSEILEVRWIR